VACERARRSYKVCAPTPVSLLALDSTGCEATSAIEGGERRRGALVGGHSGALGPGPGACLRLPRAAALCRTTPANRMRSHCRAPPPRRRLNDHRRRRARTTTYRSCSGPGSVRNLASRGQIIPAVVLHIDFGGARGAMSLSPEGRKVRASAALVRRYARLHR